MSKATKTAAKKAAPKKEATKTPVAKKSAGKKFHNVMGDVMQGVAPNRPVKK